MAPASDFTSAPTDPTSQPTIILNSDKHPILYTTHTARVLLAILTFILFTFGVSNFLVANDKKNQESEIASSKEQASSERNPTRSDIKFEKGDTIISVLVTAGISDADISTASRLLARKVRLDRIPIGQRLTLFLKHSKTNKLTKPKLLGLILHSQADQNWSIYRTLTEELILKKTSEQLVTTKIREHQRQKALQTSEFFSHTVTMQKGDTLITLLTQVGITRPDIWTTVRLLSKQLNLKRLYVGQKFELQLKTVEKELRLLRFSTTTKSNKHLQIDLDFSQSEKPAYKKTENPAPTPNSLDLQEPKPSGPIEESTTGNVVARSIDPTIRELPLVETVLALKKNEAIFDRLLDMGINAATVQNATQALSRDLDFTTLHVGQKIRLLFSQNRNSEKLLVSVIIPITKTNVVRVNRTKDGRFNRNPLSIIAVRKVSEADAPISDSSQTQEDIPIRTPDNTRIVIVTVTKGDTLEKLLKKHKASAREIRLTITSLAGVHDSNDIRVGQKIALEFEKVNSHHQLRKVIIRTQKDKTIVIQLGQEGYYARSDSGKAMEEAILLGRKLVALKADLKAGKPSKTILEAYSFEASNDKLVPTDNGQHITVEIRSGDTLFDALIAAGVKPKDSHKLISAVRPLTNPKKLKPGQKLHLVFVTSQPTTDLDNDRRLAQLLIDLNPKQRLRIARLLDGTFVSGFEERPLVTKYRQAQGVINSSLYEAASAKGVPAKTLAKLIRVFSYDVDFQRDIRKGDQFQILYETLVDETDQIADVGDVLYSALNLSGTILKVYKFTLGDGVTEDHFDGEGRSVRKALMRTPIDGARLTSSFGNRKHPTLGYTKMHRGVDFGAPTGTPIFAAGDGVVDKLGSHGAYGNYIRIRHGPIYHTAYAHLNKYARELYVGRRVKQGDIIGYVGSTGRSTGPHLHYEVLKYNKQVNPLAVKLPSGLFLEGLELANFQKEKQRLLDKFDAINKTKN